MQWIQSFLLDLSFILSKLWSCISLISVLKFSNEIICQGKQDIICSSNGTKMFKIADGSLNQGKLLLETNFLDTL